MPGNAARSARGGAPGATPPPIRTGSQLPSLQHDGFQPGGESAVARAPELKLGSGPRNTFLDMSSSSASDTTSVSDDAQHDVQVQFDESRQTAQHKPSQAQPFDVQPVSRQTAQHKPGQAQPVNVQPVSSSDICVPGQVVRPIRARQAPDRLCVGDPLDPRFNRTRGR